MQEPVVKRLHFPQLGAEESLKEAQDALRELSRRTQAAKPLGGILQQIEESKGTNCD